MSENHYRLIRHHALRSRTGNMVEFPVAIYLLFLFALFPLINLIGLALGVATVALITVQLASKASVQQNYAQALSAMVDESTAFTKSGLAKLAKLKPVGGYQNSGAQLFVQATSYTTGGTLTYGPNSAVSQPVDPSSYVYEYSVQTSFLVGPFISMSTVPGLSDIPGIGRAAELNWSATRAVENVYGVAVAANVANTGSVPSMQLGSLGPTDSGSGASPAGWNNPNIYDQIAAAGQTIVAQDVIIVPGNSNTFTSSGITVDPSENVWIDTNASGTWGILPSATVSKGQQAYTANGTEPHGTSGVWDSTLDGVDNSGWLSLIGYMGGPPPPINVGGSGQSYTNISTGNQVALLNMSTEHPTGITYPGQFFQVGNTLLNYQITAPGPLNFIMNNQNTLYPGTGIQYVRIIVTRK